jgi:hypothetical protein
MTAEFTLLEIHGTFPQNCRFSLSFLSQEQLVVYEFLPLYPVDLLLPLGRPHLLRREHGRDLGHDLEAVPLGELADVKLWRGRGDL